MFKSKTKMKGTMKPKSPQTGAEVQRQLTVSSSTGSPLVPENTKTVPLEPSSTVPRSETQNSTVEKPLLPNIESHQNFITLPQKSSSPLQTNKASSMQNRVQAENQSDHTSSNTSAETPVPSLPTPTFCSSNLTSCPCTFTSPKASSSWGQNPSSPPNSGHYIGKWKASYIDTWLCLQKKDSNSQRFYYLVLQWKGTSV